MTAPLLLTMGDPTGIGPEIIIKAALSESWPTSLPVQVVGDLGVLCRAARLFDPDVSVRANGETADGSSVLLLGDRRLQVQSLSTLPAAALRYGQPDGACGQAMADYIAWACDQCLAGKASGMVTAPINKQALQAAGICHPGHTELLAARCGVDEVVMMLAGEQLRVCLVTTHCALREVPSRLTAERILTTLRIVHSSLQRQFGLARPRLAVLALNPHAGEGGLFGVEEAEIIAPAIASASAEGIDATGPHSADTLFWFATRGDYDAVVCMYHDQGLIPLKLLHFDDGVNVTLGLPIVRTSVDHGTAYNLAGTGQASAASLIAAIHMATDMAEKGR